MAEKTIPQLQETTIIDENTLIPIDSGIQTYKLTAANLAKGIAPLFPDDSIPNASIDLNMVESVGIANWDTVSNEGEDVPGLSVTITTKGRPVEMYLVHSGGLSGFVSCSAIGASTSCDAVIYCSRAGFFMGIGIGAGADAGTGRRVTLPPSSFKWIDHPPAGTHTYQISANIPDADSSQLFIGNSKLVVREL